MNDRLITQNINLYDVIIHPELKYNGQRYIEHNVTIINCAKCINCKNGLSVCALEDVWYIYIYVCVCVYVKNWYRLTIKSCHSKIIEIRQKIIPTIFSDPNLHYFIFCVSLSNIILFMPYQQMLIICTPLHSNNVAHQQIFTLLTDYSVSWCTGQGTGLILGLHPASERRRYKVAPPQFGCAQT